MSTSRFCVVRIRGPRPYAVMDARRNQFVVDEDGGLLLSATAEDAAALAERVFNGRNLAALGVAR